MKFKNLIAREIGLYILAEIARISRAKKLSQKFLLEFRATSVWFRVVTQKPSILQGWLAVWCWWQVRLQNTWSKLIKMVSTPCCVLKSWLYLTRKCIFRSCPMSSHFESMRKRFVTVRLGVIPVLHVFSLACATKLYHNKVYIVFLWTSTMCLANALVTSNMWQVNPAELKGFEPPLKITLMLLEIPVEISEQYGSK